jgi:hypothetical protein
LKQLNQFYSKARKITLFFKSLLFKKFVLKTPHYPVFDLNDKFRSATQFSPELLISNSAQTGSTEAQLKDSKFLPALLEARA